MQAIKVTSGDMIDAVNISTPIYKGLQNEVGGWIETVRPKGLSHPYCMVIDEEGLLKQKPINKIGSLLYGIQEHGHPIVGDMVIVKEVQTLQGRDFEGLTDIEISEMTAFLAEI